MQMNYIGIDLGTTNSAICSYDGSTVTSYKSPENYAVTPSAIYIDRRCRYYYGVPAYRRAASSPDNVALHFKRFMGTDTPIAIPAARLVLSPEECSAEILRYLYAYLPEEIRASGTAGTVITVPAAFDQMQRDATLSAAELAGIGKVALMQEPVAAVMSVMRVSRQDGVFVVYDLGGGTFDIAIAQSNGGHVDLLDHDGIKMCGGRDFDRLIVEKIVTPWLQAHFKLPEGSISGGEYRRVLRLAAYAAENAKIQLSFGPSALVSLSEDEIRLEDQAGSPIYLDIPIERPAFLELIKEHIDQTIAVTREALRRTGLTSNDVNRIVFIGGPTQFKPLRDYICAQIGAPEDTKADPMTAVAEGAAVFAESIDWSAATRSRKATRSAVAISSALGLSFEIASRTPEPRASIIARCDERHLNGEHFQIDNLDSGWSSGRIKLSDRVLCNVQVPAMGTNSFRASLFTARGDPVPGAEDRLTITRTAASIDAIPAAHSVGVEIRETLYSSATKLRWLIRKGDPLPKKGRAVFKAAEGLPASSTGALIFKLYEGEIANCPTDNHFIGSFKLRGVDFETGMIGVGDDLVCDYEVADSGHVSCAVSVPSVGSTIVSGNIYSRQEGQMDFRKCQPRIQDDAEATLQKIQQIELRVHDRELERARRLLDQAHAACENPSADPEALKEASQHVQRARTALSAVRLQHLPKIRQAELDRAVQVFHEVAREHAKPAEETAFDAMTRTAERLVSDSSGDFDNVLDQMRDTTWGIMWRQDAFVAATFERFSAQPYLFPDQRAYTALLEQGTGCLAGAHYDRLREVVGRLYALKATGDSTDELRPANIVWGGGDAH
jgi:molecular chaperone DnaK